MKLSATLLIGLGLTVACAGALQNPTVRRTSPNQPAEAPTYVPNSFIVELEYNADSLASPATQFQNAQSGKVSYDVRNEFTSPNVFYGLSLTTTNDTKATDIQ